MEPPPPAISEIEGLQVERGGAGVTAFVVSAYEACHEEIFAFLARATRDRVIPGWPYRSAIPLEQAGFCSPGDTGCGSFRAAPAIGTDSVVYLVQAAASSSAGGSVVAIGTDGLIRPGWPVGLKRAGSEFWSVVVGPDQTVYALAIEPEPNGSHSATIVSLAPDSTVLHTVTIVEP